MLRPPPLLLLALASACGCGGASPDTGGGGPGAVGDAAIADAAQPDSGSVAPRDAGADGPGPKPDAAPPPAPDIDKIPWQTGGSVGYGVATKDTQNPAGKNLFIGYAGYQITLASAEAWVTALYKAKLQALGVRHIWAVQGPNDPSYSNFEIGNSKIVAAMLPLVGASTKFILVAGHSSGSFVAHEMLGQLDGGLDPMNVTAGLVVYFDLDGGESGLTASSVGRLRRAYFVSSLDGATGTYSPNADTMKTLGQTYASAGGYLENDASQSGCNAGADWCVHMTLITTKPHDPTNSDAQPDYSDFSGRPVCQAYVDEKAQEAGLVAQ